MLVRMFLVSFAAIMLLIAGCSKAPETEMKSAQDSIEKARLDEIDQYAPELFAQAVDSLNASKAEMEKQASKFALFRGYGRSKEMLVAADNMLKQAETEAMTLKEALRVQDSTFIGELTVKFEKAEAALAKAPRGKGTRADIELMKTELAAFKATFDEAAADYQNGKYMAAKNKLDAVNANIERFMTDIGKPRVKVIPNTGE